MYQPPGSSIRERESVSEDDNDNTDGPYHMTEEILRNRAETENAGRYLTQLYAGVVASVSSISFGTVVGWSSPAIRASMDKFDVDTVVGTDRLEVGLVASLAPLGCSFGVLVWSYFNIKIGPRKTMAIQSPLLFITWVVIALVKNTDVSLAGRFFCGFLAISYRVCGETLLVDSVHYLRLRYMVISFRACVYLGVLLAYICGYLITDVYFSILNCFIVALHFVLLLICPESPVYLYDVSIKQAEEALSWYRGKENIYIEMRNIKKDSEIRKVDPATYRYMFLSKVVFKAILIIVGVNVSQVVSGYYIFLYYNPAMVRTLSDVYAKSVGSAEMDSKIDVISRNIDAIIFSLNMFISSLISTWVHYSVMFGVKKPLILSSALVTSILSLLSAYYYLRERKVMYILKNNWTYMLLVNSLICAYEVGLSSCGDIMLMDYVPSQVYPRAKLIANITQWALTFIMTRCYFKITNLVKGSGTMTIFTILSLACLIFICKCVVETKGKTLIKVQTEIGGNPIGTRGVRNSRFRKSGVHGLA